MKRHNRRTSSIAVVAALVVMLGGCSGDGDNPDAESSASADLPTGDPTMETSDGGESVTSGEVNEDFPKKKVPLVKGTVLVSASSPDNGFSLTILADGDVKEVSAEAKKLLKEAGFKVRSKQSGGGGRVVVLRSPEYKVEFAATPAGTQTSVNYVVVPRGN